MNERLDQALVTRGLVESRQRAQLLIRAGQVRVNGQRVDKPSEKVTVTATLEVQAMPRFVSRGGDKLLGALTIFQPQLTGRVALDGGISTGGFSDCLLQHGVSRIYGIDVGYGQVAWTLRNDPRVVLRERTNLRHLTPDELYGATDPWPDFAVVDVSFISLAKILPALTQLLIAPKECLLLVKPQFECGREQVGKGVVRDPGIHRQVLEQLWQVALSMGWQVQGLTFSPLKGPEGNIEYWLWLGAQPHVTAEVIPLVVSQAHQDLK